jgi:DNA-binding transcriptional ArsR family regulator
MSKIATTLEMPGREELDLTRILAALGDPVRLEIVRALARTGECRCGTLDLPVSDATRSHHLRILRESGVTSTRVDGTRRFVSLRRDDLDARFPGLIDAVAVGG